MKEYVSKFKNMKIFDQIDEKDLLPMLSCLGGYVKNYKKGEFIVLKGETVNYIGVVISGSVKMVKEELWGAKSTLAVMQQGELFGEASMCSEDNYSNATFQAITDCKVLILSFQRVLHSCSNSCVFHNRMIENMVIMLAQKTIQLMKKVEITSKKSIRGRILTYLSQEMKRSDTKYFVSDMGRLELADYLSVDRSALTRELTRMKEDGLLDYDKNTFFLKDKALKYEEKN